ncbi:MAG: hypothetical protein ACRESI_01110, partial [Gammaproteobacteria bacterium]
MNAVNEAIRPYVEGFDALESGRAGNTPPWLTDLRRDAFTHFSAHGFPAGRNEDWKYTSTRPLEKRAFSSTIPEPVEIDARTIEPVLLREASAHTLVFVNGQYVPELGMPVPRIAGLRVISLKRMLEQD